MKRFLNAVILGLTALTLFGCNPSSSQESSSEIPSDEIEGLLIPRNTTAYMTLPETSKYVIPEGAETGENGGPGAMSTTAVDYSYYPDDKRPVESSEEQGTMIILYVPGAKGLTTVFDYVDACDAESVLQALKDNNALTGDVDLVSFEISEDGRSAEIEITDSTAVYAAASEDMVVTAVANTYIDNFSLDEIKVIVGGADMGTRGFSQEYEAK